MRQARQQGGGQGSPAPLLSTTNRQEEGSSAAVCQPTQPKLELHTLNKVTAEEGETSENKWNGTRGTLAPDLNNLIARDPTITAIEIAIDMENQK